MPGRQRRPRRGLPAAAGQPRREGHAHGPRQLGVGTIYFYLLIFLSYSELTMTLLVFRYGCGRENKPGVYTKVSQYVDWIYDKVQQ